MGLNKPPRTSSSLVRVNTLSGWVGLVAALLIALALDDAGEIANGDLDGEVDDGEHDGDEDVPAGETADEAASTTALEMLATMCYGRERGC